MSARAATADRILDASRRLFNDKGYAATSLAEIAAEVGISQGNLTYHFPTKLDLALHLSETVRTRTEQRRASRNPGDVADDYVESLRFAMEMSGHYRFLMRDRGIFEPVDAVVPPSPILVAALQERRDLIGRIAESATEAVAIAAQDYGLIVLIRAHRHCSHGSRTKRQQRRRR